MEAEYTVSYLSPLSTSVLLPRASPSASALISSASLNRSQMVRTRAYHSVLLTVIIVGTQADSSQLGGRWTQHGRCLSRGL